MPDQTTAAKPAAQDTPIGSPITPEQLGAAKRDAIPGWVLDAINGLLARSLRFTLTDAADAAMEHAPDGFERQSLFDLHYMDFEPVYRAAGWRVEFDKPGYCETYPARFIFRAGKS